MTSLDDLRRRINELDRQILELVGKRQETSREIVARQTRHRPRHARLQPRARRAAGGARGGQAIRRFAAGRGEHPAAPDPLLANYPGAGERRGAGRGLGPHARWSSAAPARWAAGSPSSWPRRVSRSRSRIRPARRPGSRTSPTGATPRSTTTSSSSPRRSASPTRSCASSRCAGPRA